MIFVHFQKIRPELGVLKPASADNRVDFPPPDGPRSAILWPSSIDRSAVRLKSSWVRAILSNVIVKATSAIKEPEQE